MGAVFIGFVLGEYEMQGAVPLVAGAVVGLLLSEVVVAMGRWRGPAGAAVAAAGSAGCLLLAGWVDSTQGVEPYPVLAAAGAGIGAAVAAIRVAPLRTPSPGADVS